jgi:hypothetical protein
MPGVAISPVSGFGYALLMSRALAARLTIFAVKGVEIALAHHITSKPCAVCARRVSTHHHRPHTSRVPSIGFASLYTRGERVDTVHGPWLSSDLESRLLESRSKTEARLDLAESAGWVSPSSRGLWGGHALGCWKLKPQGEGSDQRRVGGTCTVRAMTHRNSGWPTTARNGSSANEYCGLIVAPNGGGRAGTGGGGASPHWVM